MVWFKVDDSFHSHPKVLAADPAALGLWVIAGSWCGANLTDGFVPDHVLKRLLPDPDKLAKHLVAVGLWKRTRGGYAFNDWHDFNPTADAEREKRRIKAEAGRKGGLASGKTRSKPRTNSYSKREAPASAPANEADEPRPDPTRTSTANAVESTRAPVDDFELTDGLRRWVVRTFGAALNADHEAEQFVSYYRSTGARRKSWPDAFQKWCRDSAQHANDRAARAGSNGTPRPSTTEQRVAQAADIAARLRAQEGSGS